MTPPSGLEGTTLQTLQFWRDIRIPLILLGFLFHTKWLFWDGLSSIKIPTEMEVALSYTLFSLFRLATLFKLLHTAYTVACMPMYGWLELFLTYSRNSSNALTFLVKIYWILILRTFGEEGFWHLSCTKNFLGGTVSGIIWVLSLFFLLFSFLGRNSKKPSCI